MEIIKDIVNKKMESFFIGKKNHKYLIYEFYQAFSLSVAYLKLKNKFKIKDLRYRTMLWREYSWESLKDSLNFVDRDKFERADEWKKILLQHHNMLNRPYFEMFIGLIHDDEKVVNQFNDTFLIESKKEKKEVIEGIIHPDRKVRYSVGVVVRR